MWLKYFVRTCIHNNPTWRRTAHWFTIIQVKMFREFSKLWRYHNKVFPVILEFLSNGILNLIFYCHMLYVSLKWHENFYRFNKKNCKNYIITSFAVFRFGASFLRYFSQLSFRRHKYDCWKCRILVMKWIYYRN